MMPVKVFTHVAGLLQFHSGAIIQVTLSFDVPGHTHLPIEIYGTEAEPAGARSQHVRRRGEDARRRRPRTGRKVPVTPPYADANYRSLGVADMAHAILEGRPHRASGDLALHVLEVMEAFETASSEGRPVEIATPVERPAPLADSIKDGKIG